jgi:hypothetical protein
MSEGQSTARKPSPLIVEMTGKVIGRLTVLRRDETKRGGQACWVCRCECGKETTVHGSNLRQGTTQSCGCYEQEQRGASRRTHGKSRTREHRIWCEVIRRCTDPKRPAYRRYGARGIAVCERWLNSFENFLEDMGPCPTPTHSIDRIDNYHGYEPGNCRWATRSEQVLNRRNVDDLVDQRDALLAEVERLRALVVEACDLADTAARFLSPLYRSKFYRRDGARIAAIRQEVAGE